MATAPTATIETRHHTPANLESNPLTASRPRNMEIDVSEISEEEFEDEVFVSVVKGQGICPWCGRTVLDAIDGASGFCPSCAGPIQALIYLPLADPEIAATAVTEAA